MLVGSNCSERGSLEVGEVAEVGEAGMRGTRLYFVLLGVTSASISCRKERNSISAISSRVNCLEVVWFVV
jgi:hypothetical protein